MVRRSAVRCPDNAAPPAGSGRVQRPHRAGERTARSPARMFEHGRGTIEKRELTDRASLTGPWRASSGSHPCHAAMMAGSRCELGMFRAHLVVVVFIIAVTATRPIGRPRVVATRGRLPVVAPWRPIIERRRGCVARRPDRNAPPKPPPRSSSSARACKAAAMTAKPVTVARMTARVRIALTSCQTCDVGTDHGGMTAGPGCRCSSSGDGGRLGLCPCPHYMRPASPGRFAPQGSCILLAIRRGIPLT